MQNPIFLIGAPRSATTCISKIFETHPQCEAYTEVEPKLRIASRDYYEGRLTESTSLLKETRENLIQKAHQNNKVFVDKNPCYLPFTKDLVNVFSGRIVFLVRDGRDVIRSMRDCVLDNSLLYNLPEDKNLEYKINNSAELSHNERWDYSRIRPLKTEKEYTKWPDMKLLERCSWYWSKFNTLILDFAKQLPKESYTILKTDQTDATNINTLFTKLDLSKLDPQGIDGILNSRVNSIENRFKREQKIPGWKNWPEEEQRIFNHYAKGVMTELGYY